MMLLISFIITIIVFKFKKTHQNLELRQRVFFLICFFILNTIQSFGQDTIKNSINSTIPFIFTPNTYEFDIEIKKNKRIRFNSEKMLGYIFKKPGLTKIYPISIHKHTDEHNCSTIHLPDSIFILTDCYKMEFIDSTFKINSPIIKNKDTKGNFIEIQVNVTEIFNNMPIELKNTKLFSAGIGTEIYGELESKPYILKKGVNLLRYYLSGVCNMNSYIQFDFIDNVGKAHSISLNSPIKDF